MSGDGATTDAPWLDATEQTMWRSYVESTRLLFRSLDRQLGRDAKWSRPARSPTR